MFSYRPPKSSIWGHALRGKDLASVTRHVHEFLATYFEPFELLSGSMDSDFTCALQWKEGILPNNAWPDEFLARFSAAAPFKLSPKNFSVGLQSKNGNMRWRKVGGEVLARLEAVI